MIPDMRSISLNLPDVLLSVSTRCAEALGITRAEYIRRAIEDLNVRSETELRAQRLADCSRRVRAESLAVLQEFGEADLDRNG